MSKHRRRRHFLAILVAAPAIGAVRQAAAHADVHRAEPADGAVLEAAPADIHLTFTQPLRVMTLRLMDSTGREWRLARADARSATVREVRATVQDRLAPGEYRIEWRAASEDGHVGGGVLSFRVKASPA